MDKFYGPFFENNNIWHWRRECNDFPLEKNPSVMISSIFPESIELCNNCVILDSKDVNGKMLELPPKTSYKKYL